MRKIISFSGKDGVGKSTLLVLMLKYLLEKNKDLNILVIDADPDANIGDIIGKDIQFKETIGGKTFLNVWSRCPTIGKPGVEETKQPPSYKISLEKINKNATRVIIETDLLDPKI